MTLTGPNHFVARVLKLPSAMSGTINLIEIKNYQYQNVYYWFKIKTLIV